MKKFKLISCILILAVLTTITFSACNSSEVKTLTYLGSSEKITQENSPLIVAHRGLSISAPDNSLAAFRLAGEYGCYGCEFDIRTTSDGEWIVIHNDSVNKTTDGKGKVASYTYKELLQFTLKPKTDDGKYNGEKIPTLNQTLDVCLEYGLHPVIEIKSGSEADIEKLADILKSYKEYDKIIVISFVEDYLTQIRKLLPDVTILLLTDEIEQSHIDFCNEYNINGISFNEKKNTAKTISLAKNANLITSAWTVDDLEKVENMCSLGVDIITTNCIVPGNAPKEGSSSLA